MIILFSLRAKFSSLLLRSANSGSKPEKQIRLQKLMSDMNSLKWGLDLKVTYRDENYSNWKIGASFSLRGAPRIVFPNTSLRCHCDERNRKIGTSPLTSVEHQEVDVEFKSSVMSFEAMDFFRAGHPDRLARTSALVLCNRKCSTTDCSDTFHSYWTVLVSALITQARSAKWLEFWSPLSLASSTFPSIH